MQAPPPATADIRPNHTIYINNLNEKIKKEGKRGLIGFICSEIECKKGD